MTDNPSPDNDSPFTTTTHSVRVSVWPTYLASQSEPERPIYVWAYQVRIENLGEQDLQLRRRHWCIIDANGLIQEVRGDGVVGQQPLIRSGEHFEYVSGTPLPTSSGVMVGSYQMETASGDYLEVAIPAFSLDTPDRQRLLN